MFSKLLFVAANLWTSNFLQIHFVFTILTNSLYRLNSNTRENIDIWVVVIWFFKFELQAAIYVTNSFLVAIVLHVHCTFMYYYTCMARKLAFDLTGYFHNFCVAHYS